MNLNQAKEIGYKGLLFGYQYGFLIDYGKNREDVVITIVKDGNLI